MSAAHTSGPWVARAGVSGSYWEVEKDDPCQDDPWAVATAYEHADDGSAKANARLIAAAPDMLNALELAVNHWRSFGSGMPPLWFRAAEYAIAKAKGEAA